MFRSVPVNDTQSLLSEMPQLTVVRRRFLRVGLVVAFATVDAVQTVTIPRLERAVHALHTDHLTLYIIYTLYIYYILYIHIHL